MRKAELSVNSYSEGRSRKSEVRSQKSEVRCQRSVIGDRWTQSSRDAWWRDWRALPHTFEAVFA